MSRSSAVEFWARLADDEDFRVRFMAVDPGAMPGFLLKEGFDFAMEELASVVSVGSRFGISSLPRDESGDAASASSPSKS